MTLLAVMDQEGTNSLFKELDPLVGRFEQPGW
jgi:hypothetical protein